MCRGSFKDLKKYKCTHPMERGNFGNSHHSSSQGLVISLPELLVLPLLPLLPISLLLLLLPYSI